MKLDENDFFRQATIRICGSLDIETSLWQSLLYIRDIVPLDMMFLHIYERGMGSLRTLASASMTGGRKLDQMTPMSQEAIAHLESTAPPSVRIVNDPKRDPVSREIVEVLGGPDSSRLVMRIAIEGKTLGGVAFVANGKDRYSHEHARIISLLNEPFAIAMSNALRHQEVLKLKDMLADDNRFLHRELMGLASDEIVGGNLGLREVMEMVHQVSHHNSPVLLLGETGVGKDVLAHTVHSLSPRKNAPFIKVDCGAIPDTLMDTELFGHERGAFTGAITLKRGRFERADGGTIFLDEIGELPPEAQIRMLRVIEHREIERVGGSKPIHVNIRIIAATHRNLDAMVKSKQFREDLWFRLNVFPILIPPLRQRKEDIPSLVHHFMERKSKELRLDKTPKLSPGAMGRLISYHWPGNVRELQNVVERALILNKGEPVMFERSVLRPHEYHAAAPTQDSEPQRLDEAMSKHIKQALGMANGKIHGPGGAAEILGINPSTLRNRMNKLGIHYGRQR